jgi:hypothetical protein
MKIFGYENKIINEFGLMEMREITFQGKANHLRLIAKFLQECADYIESNPGDLDHDHISFNNQDWMDDFPEIVVAEDQN